MRDSKNLTKICRETMDFANGKKSRFYCRFTHFLF